MLGAIAGAISAFMNNTILALVPIIVMYVLSILITRIMFASVNRRTLFFKGTLIMFIAWFLMVIVVYNI